MRAWASASSSCAISSASRRSCLASHARTRAGRSAHVIRMGGGEGFDGGRSVAAISSPCPTGSGGPFAARVSRAGPRACRRAFAPARFARLIARAARGERWAHVSRRSLRGFQKSRHPAARRRRRGSGSRPSLRTFYTGSSKVKIKSGTKLKRGNFPGIPATQAGRTGSCGAWKGLALSPLPKGWDARSPRVR